MRRQRGGGRYGWLAAVVVLAAAARGEAAPVVRHTFEEGVGGWMGVGMNSKASLTREAAHVKEGKAALQYDYPVEKGAMGTLHLPAGDGALAKAKSIHLWVKADHTTTLAVVLQEKQGGRYSAAFAAPKERWQQVELGLSDFVLGEDGDDPKDPNNRLDPDQIEAIGIIDLAQFFAQIEDATLRELLGGQPGSHTLYVDEVTVSDEALPEAATEADGRVRLDPFNRPQLQWLGVGDVLLSPGLPGAEFGLKAEYQQGPGKIAGLVRPLPRGKLKGMERLLLDVASERSTEILVQLEEAGGGKYNAQVSVPGSSKVQKLSLAFSQFTAAADSKDENNRLDLERVKQVLILDFSGFTGAEEGDNTLRIGNLGAAPAKAER